MSMAETASSSANEISHTTGVDTGESEGDARYSGRVRCLCGEDNCCGLLPYNDDGEGD